MNESFAEYSAMIAVGDSFGQNHFEKLINGIDTTDKFLDMIESNFNEGVGKYVNILLD
ncbi:MAG: hypothetical protein E6X34_09425 [Clostridium sp.]|uniref:hypothetical protein n=1 Tax=Clostridium sp. TaxID=1506 RepID=UPI00290BFB92|nr:hypothetical protein [Clostridium sp.]MDU4938666.1 hypothetical protein [Clostridium sp.]